MHLLQSTHRLIGYRLMGHRGFQSSVILRGPRCFRPKPKGQAHMEADLSLIERMKVKENVLSLYNESDWESVYDVQLMSGPFVSKTDAIPNDADSQMDLKSIGEFLEKETGKSVKICPCHFGSNKIIVEIESVRTRLSIGEALIRRFKRHFIYNQIKREGLVEDTDWVVIDLGETIVHLMSPEAHKEYALEEIERYESLSDEMKFERKPNKVHENK